MFSAILALGLSMHAANAQSQSTIATPEKTDAPQPADRGWHVDVAPYLWFAGINGTVGALDHEASVHVSASKVLSYFNFGLMGAVETRYNRIIIPVDFMWVQFKDDKGIAITDDVGSVPFPPGVRDELGTKKLFRSMLGKAYTVRGFDKY